MNRTLVHLRRAICWTGLVAFSSARGQDASPRTFRHELFVNSSAESYLRYLQTTGLVPLYPWSSRSFSQRELRQLVPRDTAHPWRAHLADASRSMSGIRYGIIQPSTTLRYNSTFAYGRNDGPVWAGRGLTSAIELGFFASWGPVSLTVAPMAFRAENDDFDILPTGPVRNPEFGDPNRGGIDRPQRFGDTPYAQIDPGQSTVRIDLPYLAIGASTANQAWGPGQDLPVILGNNAAGFPHIFAGSSEPIDIFIGKLHGKIFWGELFQSEYSGVTGASYYVSRAEPGTKRFATGLVLIAQPRGLHGLEVGATRFFHSIWPASGIPRSYLTKSLQGFLKKDLPPDRNPDPRFPDNDAKGISDNQLVSVFARWVLPRSGFEIHAEYGREDHSYDFRDLIQEIDHSRVYSLGARKVLRSGAKRLTAGRIEIMNFQIPQLVRYREEGEIYTHGVIRQGHTYRGQQLGADVGVGSGAGSVVAVDHFTPRSRYSVAWNRTVRQENGNFLLLGVRSPRSIDVSHSLGIEASRFMRGFDVTGGLTFVYNFNRDFERDAVNLNALLGVRYLVP